MLGWRRQWDGLLPAGSFCFLPERPPDRGEPSMAERFAIRVGKELLCFRACHFLVFGPESAEPIHEHMYRMAVEFAAPLDPHGMVADFTWVQPALQRLVQQLDHRILLAGEDPRLQIRPTGDQLEVHLGPNRWEFPRSQCLLLPLWATTTELLARYLAQRILTLCQAQRHWLPERLQVELEESPGLSALVTVQPIPADR